MSLKDKINALIVGLGLTSTRFADFIGVTRPIISHILTGRNKPSLEIIQKIVSKFPELGFNWIADSEALDMDLVGKLANKQEFNSLFGNNYASRESNENNFTGDYEGIFDSQGFGNDKKRIAKIVVFYADNTFQQFGPSV